MSVETARRGSVWIDTGPDQPELPPLEDRVRADVAILGGGIVGVTAALLLKEAGKHVVLLEAGRLASGVTGFTTAKVSSQHGMIYSQLRSKFGPGGARTCGGASEGALEGGAGGGGRGGIDCGFRRQASYADGTQGADRAQGEEEAEGAQEAGLPASLVEATPLPYPV